MNYLMPHDLPPGVGAELDRLHNILSGQATPELKEWAKQKIEEFYKPFLNPSMIVEEGGVDVEPGMFGFRRR
jgi:hypothetical protein